MKCGEMRPSGTSQSFFPEAYDGSVQTRLMSTCHRVLVVLALSLISQPGHVLAQRGGSAKFSSLQQKAMELNSSDRLPEAAEAYRKALAVQPKWADGWWQFATIEYDLGNYRISRDALSRFLEFNPKGGSAWALKGLSEYELGTSRIALADLHRGNALGVTEENNLRGIAKLHELLLDNVTGNFEHAFVIAEELCSHDDASFPLAIAAGTTALRIESLPSAIPANQRDLVSRAGEAVCDATASRTEKADAEFTDLLHRYPATPQLHYLYGCFLIKDHPDDGLEQLLAELSISPAHEPAMTEVALEYLRRGDDQKALPYAEQAVKSSPHSERAQLAMGRVMVDLNHMESGVEHLQQAVALSPADRSALWALASAYSSEGNDRAAEQIRRRLKQ
jgi:tetratricopeptide (TPR) repeat protein